ncbi:phosphoserine phosphatase SerB [Alteraurantiacibacter palmitatis]|uniref:Phosphoserine phosphatase n=1 Tax=Alteraurantiacibacter palmitatis TaxID=2054628 RepID=A0ABV7E4M0_9SPHN
MLIARLIADTANLETRLDALAAQLAERGVAMASAGLLDGCGDVLEIATPSDDMAALRAGLDAHFSPSDAIIATAPFAVPHLFVSDMDSTMIGQECIDELADFAGIKHHIAAITERAMQGELDFESALRERVMLLRDLSAGAIAECLATRITPMPGARVLVETLKSRGCRTVLVTGGFHQFADPVAEMLGFERVVGNRLDVVDEVLTGGLVGPITDSSVKRTVLLEEASELGGNVVTLATGDGANDIPMIAEATYGIAYHAKPKARDAANGWIDRGDLTSVLKLLGVPEKEWVGR